jgi:hypothetical protein
VADGIAKDHEDIVAADGLAGVAPGKSHWVCNLASTLAKFQVKQGTTSPLDPSAPLMHGDCHARRIDVVNSQTSYFGASQAGGGDGHQHGAAFEISRRGEYPCYLLGTEDQGKLLHLAGEWNVFWLEGTH